MRGPLTALDIAHELKITKEGVRQQLVKFMEEGLIEVETESKGVGRPQKYFTISEIGNRKFPDTHAELTVKLLTIIKMPWARMLYKRLLMLMRQQVKKDIMKRSILYPI
ncbi:hypothetical protein OKW96_12865 [Sphingobacterium sp. KU25419]|nr:hypothetical protein OKW96_12865 [Sphingobacterium sp. KU25419]